jgi:hypothetical protein
MLFVNHVPDESKKIAKLLYIMGATWHTKSMFDLDTDEDSFSDILVKHGIETYAIDLIGCGDGGSIDNVSDPYQHNLEYLKLVIKEHEIDYIMGYSTGCILAKELALSLNIKGVIFLDPSNNIILDKKLINDMFLITKQSVRQALVINGTNIKQKIVDDHINSLCNDEILKVAAYPITGKFLKNFLDPNGLQNFFNVCNVQTFFTQKAEASVRSLFPSESTFYENSSHWIMLEDGRYQLAHDIVKFVNP